MRTLVVLLVGCGRLGFDPPITTDSAPQDAPGCPATLSAIDSNTRALFRFDEGTGTTTADETGAFDAVFFMTPDWVDGRFGKALRYDENTLDRLETNAGSVSWAPPFSLEMWVFPDGDSDGSAVIFSEGTACAGVSYWILNGRGTLRLCDAQVVSSTNVSTGPLADATWTYLAATYDGVDMRVYKDGALVGSLQPGLGPLREGSMWGIGGYATDAHFNGIIDELRISTAIRSDTEIAAAWAAGSCL